MVKTKKEFELNGITYFYSVEADTRNPGKYIYGLQAFVDGTVSSGSDFSPSISQTINGVVSELQKEISELENSAAIQQRTLARLEEQLQNPNLTPAERAALQDRIDDFKVIIAETQAAIAGTQRAIAEVQKVPQEYFRKCKRNWNLNWFRQHQPQL
jgi:prefoldin subunit 5